MYVVLYYINNLRLRPNTYLEMGVICLLIDPYRLSFPVQASGATPVDAVPVTRTGRAIPCNFLVKNFANGTFGV